MCKSMNIQFDIIISGNGLIGKIAALSMARAGFSVAIAGPRNKDSRTTALMMPSIHHLKHLDVWEEISRTAAPLSSLRIIDATRALIRARPALFHAHEMGEKAFGYNCINHDMNIILEKAILASPLITYFETKARGYDIMSETARVTLEDNTQLTAKLIIGADGKNSGAREAAGIKIKQWDYPQTAFVTTFSHSLPHDNISTEFHTSFGPCVQVPLSGNRSSLVWVTQPAHARELMNMAAEELSLAIEQQLHSIVGKVEVSDARAHFPLSCHYAKRFAENRIALVGEAAHVFPPIGAQGANVSIRDVQDLCTCLARNRADVGANSVLNHYHNKRYGDIMTRLYSIDALNKSLLSSRLPVHAARAFGIELLNNIPPLRNFIMRQGLKNGIVVK
jgi:2-octaprenyl-6-methoxyphenol hydroxylase